MDKIIAKVHNVRENNEVTVFVSKGKSVIASKCFDYDCDQGPSWKRKHEAIAMRDATAFAESFNPDTISVLA